MDFKIEHKAVSLADQIFEKLENDILIGEYARGEVLTEMKLSESLGVSRTPIREALRRLEQENIITMTSKGAVVVGISPEDIETIYEIRIRIEGYAARCAATEASPIDRLIGAVAIYLMIILRYVDAVCKHFRVVCICVIQDLAVKTVISNVCEATLTGVFGVSHLRYSRHRYRFCKLMTFWRDLVGNVAVAAITGV